MNYLSEFDEELYESLVENIAASNKKRYKYEDKNKFISNLSFFLKDSSNLFCIETITKGWNKDNYLISFNHDSSSEVVFSVHYDTVKNTPGFNDNSSGIILSLMFLLKAKIPVLLTDREEKWLKGAKAICEEGHFKNQTIIVLDSVGVGDYLIYNCSKDFKTLLKPIKKEKHMLFRKHIFLELMHGYLLNQAIIKLFRYLEAKAR